MKIWSNMGDILSYGTDGPMSPSYCLDLEHDGFTTETLTELVCTYSKMLLYGTDVARLVLLQTTN